jgi:hypothetical protein
MGLDMYLEGKTFNWTDWDHPERNPKHDGFRVKGLTLELGYWRKHPDLHGYIVQQFAGGVDECQEIPLTVENIRQIIATIKAKQLPHTEGFFFGSSDGSEDAKSVAIFERALAWLDAETPPTKHKSEPIGDSGLTMVEVRPEDFVKAKESRDVVYRASW